MFNCIDYGREHNVVMQRLVEKLQLPAIFHLDQVIDDKRQPWPNADKKSGPQLLTGPKLLSFGPTLFKY